MDSGLFLEFRRLADTGRRAEAARALAAFVASFAGLDERIAWTRDYLEQGPAEPRIRHELYERVVFPALLDGWRRSDPWSLRWLARTAQNLYRADALWRQVDHATEEAFLHALLAQCPRDEDARAALLACVVVRLRHAIHEWPAGILHGRDGATLAQCAEVREDIAQARTLDAGDAHAAFLADVEGKVAVYEARLMARRAMPEL